MSVESTQFHDDHRPLRERSEIGGNALLAFAPETSEPDRPEPDRPIEQLQPGKPRKPGRPGKKRRAAPSWLIPAAAGALAALTSVAACESIHARLAGAPAPAAAVVQWVNVARKMAGALLSTRLNGEMSNSSPAVGQLSISSDQPGASVLVDGQPRGASPVTVRDVSVGEHIVVVKGDRGSAGHAVTVRRGMTESVVFSLAPSSAGWFVIATPFDVEVFEHGALIGASKSAKTMVASGRHDLEFVNGTLGYRERHTIEVAPGRITTVRIHAPGGTFSATARPWADVSVDGRHVGQTPVSNLVLPIGPHDVVFRHPQLGERRQRILVTLKRANRLAVDLSK